MSEWIECGLPWYSSGGHLQQIKYPKISNRRIKKEFGKTTIEAHALLPPIGSKGYKKAIKEFQDFSRQVSEWTRIQPEFIAYHEEIVRMNEEMKAKSFCGLGLNKPGTLIEVGLKQYLIGDINVNGGVCDDCVDFGNDAIVLRYKEPK